MNNMQHELIADLYEDNERLSQENLALKIENRDMQDQLNALVMQLTERDYNEK